MIIFVNYKEIDEGYRIHNARLGSEFQQRAVSNMRAGVLFSSSKSTVEVGCGLVSTEWGEKNGCAFPTQAAAVHFHFSR